MAQVHFLKVRGPPRGTKAFPVIGEALEDWVVEEPHSPFSPYYTSFISKKQNGGGGSGVLQEVYRTALSCFFQKILSFVAAETRLASNTTVLLMQVGKCLIGKFDNWRSRNYKKKYCGKSEKTAEVKWWRKQTVLTGIGTLIRNPCHRSG